MKRAAAHHRRAPTFAVAALVLCTRTADAQLPEGFALNRFEPSTAGDPFFFAEHPWYSSTRRFAAAIVFDHAVNPLLMQPAGGSSRAIVSGMSTGYAALAASFFDRLGLSLSMPVSLMQSGERTMLGTGTYGPASAAAPGDLRAGLRVRLFGHADREPFSLHLGLNVWIPTGAQEDNTSDGLARVEPRLTLAGRGGPVRWSFSSAFTVRETAFEQNVVMGNELRVNAALGVVLAADRLTLGPEVNVWSPLASRTDGGSAFFANRQWGGEVILGVHYLIADVVLVGGGGGFGVGQGAGVAGGRAMLSVAYAPVTRVPPVIDRDDAPQAAAVIPEAMPRPRPEAVPLPLTVGDLDGDGVLDDVDRCPDVAQGPRPSVARRGCPTLDADHDGILDPPDGPDVCPSQPETFNSVRDDDGCPDGDALAVQSGEEIRIVDPVNFRSRRDRIVGSRSFAVLDSVVALLRAMPQITQVDVQGHTDHRGSAEHNRDLSARRAASVRSYLISHGIAEGRLVASGLGADCPRVAGAHRVARAANRRVQFFVVTPESPVGRCHDGPAR